MWFCEQANKRSFGENMKYNCLGFTVLYSLSFLYQLMREHDSLAK